MIFGVNKSVKWAEGPGGCGESTHQQTHPAALFASHLPSQSLQALKPASIGCQLPALAIIAGSWRRDLQQKQARDNLNDDFVSDSRVWFNGSSSSPGTKMCLLPG